MAERHESLAACGSASLTMTQAPENSRHISTLTGSGRILRVVPDRI